MQLLDELRREHERIDTVLGSLRTWAGRLARGEAPLAHRAGFVTFFTTYAGAFHHEREEEILFPALTREAGLPAERGPIAVLLDDHHRIAALLQKLSDASDPAEIAALALAYSHALWMHIDVENYVFFPESEQRLESNGVHELDTRAATASETAAASLGDALIALYPPIEPDVIRGDGCVMCHAFGDTCRGLEREWWTEWEWDELHERVAAS